MPLNSAAKEELKALVEAGESGEIVFKEIWPPPHLAALNKTQAVTFAEVKKALSAPSLNTHFIHASYACLIAHREALLLPTQPPQNLHSLEFSYFSDSWLKATFLLGGRTAQGFSEINAKVKARHDEALRNINQLTRTSRYRDYVLRYCATYAKGLRDGKTFKDETSDLLFTEAKSLPLEPLPKNKGYVFFHAANLEGEKRPQFANWVEENHFTQAFRIPKTNFVLLPRIVYNLLQKTYAIRNNQAVHFAKKPSEELVELLVEFHDPRASVPLSKSLEIAKALAEHK